MSYNKKTFKPDSKEIKSNCFLLCSVFMLFSRASKAEFLYSPKLSETIPKNMQLEISLTATGLEPSIT